MSATRRSIVGFASAVLVLLAVRLLLHQTMNSHAVPLSQLEQVQEGAAEVDVELLEKYRDESASARPLA